MYLANDSFVQLARDKTQSNIAQHKVSRCETHHPRLEELNKVSLYHVGLFIEGPLGRRGEVEVGGKRGRRRWGRVSITTSIGKH